MTFKHLQAVRGMRDTCIYEFSEDESGIFVKHKLWAAISEKIPVNIIELTFHNIIFLDSEGTSRDKSQVGDVEDSLLGT